MLDLVLRNGRIVDGTGAPGFNGDIGIAGEHIVAVGSVPAEAVEIVDASGCVLTPGFVDIHTHYDGQATWDSVLAPSSLHGVTSIVFGNCGVGFAPARPDRHDWLINLLEGVEDIPGTALSEGLSWDWETFPEYLDALQRRRYKLDVAAQLPHAALRTYVMGDRGADADAQPDACEIATMARLAAEAIEAGAIGFSTCRTLVHKTRAGQTIGTYRAPEAELLAIAEALHDAGNGVIQLISDAYLLADEQFAVREFELIEAMARISGRPLSLTVQQANHVPDRWRWMLTRIQAMRAAGLDVSAQVASRAIGAFMGLRTNVNPFVYTPSWPALSRLPHADLVKTMSRADVRSRLLDEIKLPFNHPFADIVTKGFDRMFRVEDPVDYEPLPERSIGSEARRCGREPTDYAYDVLLEGNGTRLIYSPALNYSAGNLDDVHAMMSSEFALFGLSDGGAHCGTICDASFPTTTIGLWSRGNRAGKSIPLEKLVHGYTQRNARHVGWTDRGVLASGYLADVNVIDLDKLALAPPLPVHDLPAGGMRLMQRARGYRCTIKRGAMTFVDGEPNDRLPGRLVRGGRGLAVAHSGSSAPAGR